MLHLGQSPGASETTSGCIGQTYAVRAIGFAGWFFVGWIVGTRASIEAAGDVAVASCWGVGLGVGVVVEVAMERAASGEVGSRWSQPDRRIKSEESADLIRIMGVLGAVAEIECLGRARASLAVAARGSRLEAWSAVPAGAPAPASTVMTQRAPPHYRADRQFAVSVAAYTSRR
jgi:hypothetical protein